MKKIFNPNGTYNYIFDKIIKECENKHVPMKIVEMNRESKFKELLPEHIRLKIRKKHNLWKLNCKKAT